MSSDRSRSTAARASRTPRPDVARWPALAALNKRPSRAATCGMAASPTSFCRTFATASASCEKARCLRPWRCCHSHLASAPSPRSTRSSMRCCSRRCPSALQRSSCCSRSAWARATASRLRPTSSGVLATTTPLPGCARSGRGLASGSRRLPAPNSRWGSSCRATASTCSGYRLL